MAELDRIVARATPETGEQARSEIRASGLSDEEIAQYERALDERLSEEIRLRSEIALESATLLTIDAETRRVLQELSPRQKSGTHPNQELYQRVRVRLQELGASEKQKLLGIARARAWISLSLFGLAAVLAAAYLYYGDWWLAMIPALYVAAKLAHLAVEWVLAVGRTLRDADIQNPKALALLAACQQTFRPNRYIKPERWVPVALIIALTWAIL